MRHPSMSDLFTSSPTFLQKFPCLGLATLFNTTATSDTLPSPATDDLCLPL